MSATKVELARITHEAEKLDRFSPLGEKAEAIALELLRVFRDAELTLRAIQSGEISAADRARAYETIADGGHSAANQATEFMLLAAPASDAAQSGEKKSLRSKKPKSLSGRDALEKILSRELARAEKEQIAVGELLERLNTLAELGELAASVAHDIRTPLTSIIGFAELASRVPSSAETTKMADEAIAAQIGVGREIAGGLLDFARGRSREPVEVEVGPMISRAMRLISGALKKEDIAAKIELSATSASARILGDQCDLGRMLIQLAKNAKEAFAGVSPPPGEKKLTVRAHVEDGLVRIEVADTGPGIDPSIRDRLFQDFVTANKSEGTGLGLFGVKRIVERHGGTIGVESEVGRGATFVIKLPRVE